VASRAAGTVEEDIDHLRADVATKGTGHSQWVAVALTTMANGGDNLGVYVPLFSRELVWIPVYATVFIVMTAVWCGAGYWLVHHPVLGARIRQYGHIALPFVLLGLGLYILADARLLIR
jgi:cadmium resistance protein CadD (predicted permease)